MQLFVTVLLALFVMAACSSTLPIPSPDSEQSSALGIFVKVRIHGLAGYRADTVYFVRQCPESGDCRDQLHATQFGRDGRAYLLNAEPGEYRAVAAAFESGVPGDHSIYFAYFPEALARSSATTVTMGEWAYAGSYTVSATLGLCPDNAEADQLRYAQIIEPDSPKCGFWKPLMHKLGKADYVFIAGKAYQVGSQTFHYRGTTHEITRLPGDQAEFLLQMSADLAGAGWKVPR